MPSVSVVGSQKFKLCAVVGEDEYCKSFLGKFHRGEQLLELTAVMGSRLHVVAEMIFFRGWVRVVERKWGE